MLLVEDGESQVGIAMAGWIRQPGAAGADFEHIGKAGNADNVGSHISQTRIGVEGCPGHVPLWPVSSHTPG